MLEICRPSSGLSGLAGPEVALLPFIIAALGGAAATATWLTSTGWSSGDYNNYLTLVSNTFTSWEALGKANGCWQKYPAKHVDWVAFWKRFSTHAKEHPRVSTYSFVSDSEEGPLRAAMVELVGWANWMNSACNAGIINPLPNPDTTGTDWATIVKWGAIGIGSLVVLNIFTSVRSAFPQSPQPPQPPSPWREEAAAWRDKAVAGSRRLRSKVAG